MSTSFGWNPLKKIKHAVASVAKVAVAPVKVVTHVASQGVSLTGKAVGHIPVVGKPFHAAINLANSPLQTAEKISSGTRIDKALVGQLKNNVQSVSDIAPYAQIVIHQVPLLGNTVNSAISAGLSLAHGKSITQAVKNGVRELIPASAQKAFDLGADLASQPVDNRDKMEKALASFKTNEEKTAFHTGMALGHGKRLQGSLFKVAKAAVPTMKKTAVQVTSSNPVLNTGNQILASSPSLLHGYQVGIGATQHATPVAALTGMQNGMSADEKRGFNLAMAVFTGIKTKNAPGKLSPREQFGYYAIHGMSDAPKNQRLSLLDAMSHDNSVRLGATTAISELNSPWWKRVLAKLHDMVPHKKVA